MVMFDDNLLACALPLVFEAFATAYELAAESMSVPALPGAAPMSLRSRQHAG